METKVENDTVAYYRTCVELPPRVNSEKPWFTKNGPHVLSSLPALQMEMCLIFFGTLFFKSLFFRLGIPRFTSMSIVGLILGRILNQTWAIKKKMMLFSSDSQENLGLLAVFGYMFFLFYIGVKTDISLVHKTRRIATYIGSVSIMAPFLCCMAVLNFHSSKYLQTAETTKLGAIIGFSSITPFPVISSLLSDLKILNSELGRIGLSSSLVCEMSNIFITTVIAFGKLFYQYGKLKSFTCLAALLLFVLVVIFIIRPTMFWIIRQTPEDSPVSDHYVYSILIMALSAAYATHAMGFFALLGPFVLGLAIPEGPPLGTAIIKKFDTFVNEIFVPLFVTTCAMRVDLKDFMTWKKEDGSYDQFMVQSLVIAVVAFLAKFFACMVPPLRSKMPFNDAVCLALIVSCKGIVDMAAFSLTRDAINLPDNVFSLLMMCIIVNATVVPMLLRVFYDPMKKYAGYTKRNIADLINDTELRVVACINRTDNIPPTINLLEATYPTKEEPLCIHVLQLIELIGRASPLFICHQLQTKKKLETKNTTDTSMAEKLLESFHNFEREFKECLIVNTYTIISPIEMMYDDICTMALDKLSSLIILPFHRKWSSDGTSIEFEDESLRDLNYRVMERAPCSVGVLIERAQMTHVFSPETPYNVCLLFIGGKDDREAFFFAKRMTKNPHVRLTVVRFLSPSCDHDHDGDGDVVNEKKSNCDQDLLDNKLLNDVKMKNKVEEGSGSAYVEYIEEVVKDGPETVLVIRNLVSEFDLIVVGRHARIETPQTSGLLQWSEYPELGVLGDLLASTDAAGKASVFVIQQQITVMDA